MLSVPPISHQDVSKNLCAGRKAGLIENRGDNARINESLPAMNLQTFFAELKRRNVYKVAVTYVVVGWLLVQVARQVFPFFEIPNW
jgi:hypothetical protein